VKKTILLFILVFASGVACFAQSFSLADDFGVLKNGSEIFQSGPSDTLQLITWLHITNKTTNTRQVMMKKENLTMLPGGSSSICWAGYCYGPDMTVSTFPLTMLPGETVSGCFGHFGPNGCRGVSVIRWGFYNEANPTDSVSITVHYSTFPAATTETSPFMPLSLSVAGRIPADHQIDFRYTLPQGKQGRIELSNLSGKLVSHVEIVLLSGTVTFCTTELPSGVYLCTLWVDHNPIVRRKVAVSH
jgi:hypothetical protein